MGPVWCAASVKIKAEELRVIGPNLHKAKTQEPSNKRRSTRSPDCNETCGPACYGSLSQIGTRGLVEPVVVWCLQRNKDKMQDPHR